MCAHVCLQVTEILTDKELKGTVLVSHKLGQRKNCNLPGVVVDLPVLADKDINDVKNFACKNNMDFIFASFVQTADDVRMIRRVSSPGLTLLEHTVSGTMQAMQLPAGVGSRPPCITCVLLSSMSYCSPIYPQCAFEEFLDCCFAFSTFASSTSTDQVAHMHHACSIVFTVP